MGLIKADEICPTTDPKRVYWYAKVWDTADPQMAYTCGHRHKTWAAAKRCSRRMQNKWSKDNVPPG